MRFNSLQTGKTFRTQDTPRRNRNGNQVSIPFKREGLSERLWKKDLGHYSITFQFPSNGNDFQNRTIENLSNQNKSFNSLQTGRTFRTSLTGREMLSAIWFQFPSNGKDFPNEVLLLHQKLSLQISFNSLQTGRTFRTRPHRRREPL